MQQLKPQDRGDPGGMDQIRTDLSEFTDLVPGGGGVLKGRRFFFAKKNPYPWGFVQADTLKNKCIVFLGKDHDYFSRDL